MSQDPFAAASLLAHVRVLADEIGPRPAGHPAELRARRYIRQKLEAMGYEGIELLPFQTPDTWGYALALPIALGMATNLMARPGKQGKRKDRVLGGLLTLGCAAAMWGSMRGGRQPFAVLAPRRPSATLLVRIPPAGEPRQRVVLLGHTDSNKHRPSFGPERKKGFLGLVALGWGALVGNGLAQIAEGLGAGTGASLARWMTLGINATTLSVALSDEQGPFVAGANDNATAVACLLGMAAHLRAAPLQHTEVWLAFTGAEEVGCMGAHALLDVYGDELRDAWFLDLEMVGTEEVVYVKRHSGLSAVSTYTPDPESLAWAAETAARHPELGVTGREIVIGEEIGTLRGRGYRGICLAGVGPDGWLAQWHQTNDTTENLVPAGLEKAARFSWAMLETLDRKTEG